MFAKVHPFYFLKSTEMDPALCFLALRRPLEYGWSMSSEACTYEFESGRASGMSHMELTHSERRGPRTFTYEDFAPSARVSVPLTAPDDAGKAYERFKELNRFHFGGKCVILGKSAV